MTPSGLDRFTDAQDRVWPQVVDELAQGHKTGHWMWFVFPQLAGLGRSATAQHYGIRDREEARAYLDHPVLGQRLRQCCLLMLGHATRRPQDILGPLDAMKLRSSMTLFSQVPDAPHVVTQVLDVFYDGAPCPLTLEHLRR